jgi:hypothetical protein
MNVELSSGLFLHSYAGRCFLRILLCLCIYDSFNDALSSSHYTRRGIVGQLRIIGKELAVA